MTDPFAGAVLAGGASRRMGQDKAFVEVGGRPLVVRVADALAAAGADPVVVVGGDADRLGDLGLSHVPDRWPGEGPLGGLVTALAGSTRPVTVVSACDLPFVTAASVRAALRALRPDADAALPPSGQLHGAFRTSVAPRLEERFVAGDRSLRTLRTALAVVDIRELAPSVTSDVDTPASLDAARRTVDRPDAGEVPEIDIDELERRRVSGVPLIDVREPDEYQEARVPGAILVPLATLPERLGEIPDEPVCIICAGGGRSRKAAEYLVRQGRVATNVAGGTKAWVASGRPYEAGDATGGKG